jgi:MoaA/NifB/PqqE/SkfB family radical SAM enzyme
MKSYANQKNFYAGAMLEITSNCNFRCIHCYNDDALRNRVVLMSDVEMLASQLEKLGVIFLTLTGGEALLHPCFEDIYVYFKKKGFIVSIFSNLSYANNYVDLFKLYQPFRLSATIYGLSSEDYFKFTQKKGQFESIKKNIELLVNQGIVLELKVMVTNQNYQDVINGKYETFANKYLCPISYDCHIFSTKGGNKKPIQQRVSCNKAAIVQKKYGLLTNEQINNMSPQSFFCENGNSYIYIDVNGDVSVCMKDVSNKISIYEDTCLIKKFIATRAKKIHDDANTLKCSSCKKNLGCGWCPVEFQYDEQNDIENSFLCQVRCARMEE